MVSKLKLFFSFAVLVLLFSVFAVKAEAKTNVNIDVVREVVLETSLPGMVVNVAIEKCDEVNAYYFPSLKKLTICEEVLALNPGLVRYYVAHEMGHAIIHQLDLPYTGSQEVAADEFAAIYLSIQHPEALKLVEDMWGAKMMKPDGAVPSWDEHPDNAQRYHTFRCYRQQVFDVPRLLCWVDINRSKRAWAQLLVGALQR